MGAYRDSLGPDGPHWTPGLEDFQRIGSALIESGWRPICDVMQMAELEKIDILCLYGVVRGWHDEAGYLWATYGGKTWPVHGVMFRETSQ